MRFGRLFAVLALAAAGLAGCADAVDDINTVQPDVLEKAMFEGEWYYRQTIVDVSPEVDFGFIGLEADMEKIRFEIRENHLAVYRVTETVPGLEENDLRDGADFQGDPVAVFPILGHFDIRRDYSASTGEESNIISEDSSSRPWWERDYFRVDWTVNRVDSPVDFSGVFNLVSGLWNYGSVSNDYIRAHELNDPDHFFGSNEYIHVAGAYKIESGFGCYLSYGTWDACGNAEARVRHAFMKVKPEVEEVFEPRRYDDLIELRDDNGSQVKTLFLPVARLNATVGRGGLCRETSNCGSGLACIEGVCTDCGSNEQCLPGEACVTESDGSGACTSPFVELACTDELFEYLDNSFAKDYFTINDCDPASYTQFERFGFFRTERYNFDRRLDGGNDETREFYANIHNIWQSAYEFTTNDAGEMVMRRDENGNKIRIAPSERRLKPIVYTLGVDFPRDLDDINLQVAGDWNVAFMEVAKAATGKSADEIMDQLEADYGSEEVLWVDGDPRQHRAMFQVRRNNCSPEGLQAWFGKSEKNADMAWSAALGLGHDEETARGMSSSEVVSEFTESPGAWRRVCARLRTETHLAGLETPFEWQQIGDMRHSFLYWVNEAQPSGPLGYGPSSTNPVNGHILTGNSYIYGQALDISARSATDVIMAMTEDGYIDSLLSGQSYADWLRWSRTKSVADMNTSLSPEVRNMLVGRLHGLELGQDSVGDALDLDLDFASEKAAMDPRAQLEELKFMRQASNTQERPEFIESEGRAKLRALAEDPRFADRLVSSHEIELLKPLYGVQPGDELPEELRQAATEMVVDRDAFSDRILEKRDFLADRNIFMADFVDDAVIGKALSLQGNDRTEIYNQLRREIYRAVQLHEIGHTVGLTHNFEGSIDAMNYHDEYWELLENGEAESEAGTPLTEGRKFEFMYSSIMDYHGRFHADTSGLGKYDIAAVKAAYAGTTEVFADDVPLAATPDLAVYVAYLYGNESIPELVGSTANIANRKDVPIGDFVEDYRQGVFGNTRAFLEDPDRPTTDYFYSKEVPFNYCEHRYVFRARCKQFDIGSSHTEIVQNSIQRYWNYFAFNNFRRGRQEFGFVNGFFGRQAGIADDLTYPLRYYYFQRGRTTNLSRDYLEASLLGINFINQVIGTPRTGRHCLDTTSGAYVPENQLAAGATCDDSIDIPAGTGRYPYLRISDEYYYQFDYIGTFYDQSNFMFYLMDDSTNFFNVSDIGDSRRFSINYWRVFRPEMIQMVRDLVFSFLGENDATAFTSMVEPGGSIRPPLLVDPSGFGFGDEEDTTGMARVTTPVSYDVVWRALLYASVLNTTYFDYQHDFIEYVTVLEEGTSEDRRRLPAVRSTTGPFAMSEGDTLGIEVEDGNPETDDSEPQMVTFTSENTQDLSRVSSAEVATAINEQITGARAYLDGGGAIIIESNSVDRRASVKVQSGTLAGAFNFEPLFTIAEFVHPVTKAKYYAPQAADGLSIAYEVINYYNDFVRDVWTPANERANAVDATTADRAAFQAAERRLGEFTDLLNDMRLLRTVTYINSN